LTKSKVCFTFSIAKENAMLQSSQDSRDESRWPLSQMLLRGTFGTGSRAEHRLATRSTIIFVILLGWLMVSRLTHVESGVRSRAITVLLTALALTYYAWEKRKYFLSLDELPRRIELEGMAWAYVVGVIAALWAGSIGYVASVFWPQSATIDWWRVPFIFAIVLALVKGTYRYFATRRY
jgi:hypothetical protein